MLFSVVSIKLGESLEPPASWAQGTFHIVLGRAYSQWGGAWKGANIVAFCPANSIYFLSTYYVASTVLGKCSALLQFTRSSDSPGAMGRRPPSSRVRKLKLGEVKHQEQRPLWYSTCVCRQRSQCLLVVTSRDTLCHLDTCPGQVGLGG